MTVVSAKYAVAALIGTNILSVIAELVRTPVLRKPATPAQGSADTRERPYECPRCSRAFSRRDVLEKHARRCKHVNLPSEPRDSHGPPSSRPPRSKIACDRCRELKLKCDDQIPCAPCRRRSFTCVVTNPRVPRGKSATGLGQSIFADRHADYNLDQSLYNPTPNHDSVMDLDSSTEVVAFEGATTSNLSGPARVSFPGEFLSLSATHFAPPDPTIISWEEGLSVDPATLLEPVIPHIGQHNILLTTEPSAWSHFEQEADLMESYFTQLPAIDFGNWLHSIDDAVSNMLSSSPISGGMANAIAMMKEHFQTKSGAASPFTSDSHHMWYSAPPRLQTYDRDMVNVLLNVAKRQIGDTFALLIPSSTSADVEEELIMAIAAVGALYSDVVGSDRVARACYNDARRIVLAKNRLSTQLEFKQCLHRTKTFIMLEVYGLCSGDGRSYEFVEALHGYVLQMLRGCDYLSPKGSNSASDDDELHNVVGATYLLESYRVLLLQRPPTLNPLTHEFVSSHDTTDSASRHSLHNLANLLSPKSRTRTACGNLSDLSMIACLTWFPGPCERSGRQEPQLWKADFVELALTRWGEAITRVDEPFLLVLYHMAHLNLHSDLGLLQRHARKAAKGRRIPSSPSSSTSINKWIASQQYDISAWHAERMLKVTKSAFGGHRRATRGSGSSEQQLTAQGLISEPPHLPFCIYFASLVLWYGCLRPAQEPSRGDLCIVNGTTLLSRLKVQVARNLSNALHELTLED